MGAFPFSNIYLPVALRRGDLLVFYTDYATEPENE